MESQVAREERPPRQGDLGALELEDGLALPVGHAHAVQDEQRPQPVPAGIHVGHGHVHAGGARDRGRDVVAVIVDLREDDVAKGEHHGEERDERDAGQGCRDARDGSGKGLDAVLGSGWAAGGAWGGGRAWRAGFRGIVMAGATAPS